MCEFAQQQVNLISKLDIKTILFWSYGEILKWWSILKKPCLLKQKLALKDPEIRVIANNAKILHFQE